MYDLTKKQLEGCTIIKKHISEIKPGDTVLHYDEVKTVSRCNLGRSEGIGLTLFGDSYMSGYKPVLFVEFTQAEKVRKYCLSIAKNV